MSEIIAVMIAAAITQIIIMIIVDISRALIVFSKDVISVLKNSSQHHITRVPSAALVGLIRQNGGSDLTS